MLNPAVTHLACAVTGQTVDHDGWRRPVGRCRCGRPVVVHYGDGPWTSQARGMWRYGPRLPVAEVPAGYAEDVGGTPLVEVPELGFWIKNESTNPTGSFKDRGLAMGVALGAACGAQRFCLPTQGNAGVSAALFCARLGLLPALVYMPAGHRDGWYHRAAALYGAEVRFHGANIAAAGARMRDEMGDRMVDLSTFFEPGRLEGKKTLGFEIFEQMGVPDVVVYPTGGGTGLVGIDKAFTELIALGLTDRRPRMVAVQSTRCCPIVRAWERGLDDVEPVVSEVTIADGLDVPGAIMGPAILRVLRESGGSAVAVTDEAIRAAWLELNGRGIAVGLEGAATLAAARTLAPDSGRVLLLLTGGPAPALFANS